MIAEAGSHGFPTGTAPSLTEQAAHLGVRRHVVQLGRSNGEDQAEVGDERFVAHAGERKSRLGSASGASSQAAEKPCDSMPNAMLVRVMRFVSAMNAVGSTSARAPSASSSRAQLHATLGGVAERHSRGRGDAAERLSPTGADHESRSGLAGGTGARQILSKSSGSSGRSQHAAICAPRRR
jgi:hypothetical protein